MAEEKDSFVPLATSGANDSFVPTSVPQNPAVAQAANAIQPQMLRHFLPFLLGGAGGFVPGPVGIHLSTLGGAVGRQMNGEPQSPSIPLPTGAGYPPAAIFSPEALAAGGEQGALTAAGLGLGRGATLLGESLYRGALRPSAALIAKNPNVVRDMMNLRIPLGNRVASGAMADKALSEATARSGALLDAAEQAGKTVSTLPALKAGQELINKVARSGLKTNERVALLQKQMRIFMRDNANDLTPNQANDLIVALQEDLQPVFAAAKKGDYVKGGSRLVAKFQQRIEGAMRQGLRDAVPGIEQAKRATLSAQSAKMGAAHAASNAERGVVARLPLVPTMGQALIPHEIRSIPVASRLGLAVDSPLLRLLLGQVPRGAAAAFTPPDTTNQQP